MIAALSQDGIEEVHEATLKVLANAGIWLRDCPEAIEILEDHGCEVDGHRVRLPGSVVEECLSLLPKRDDLRLCNLGLSHADGLGLKEGESHVGLVGNAYYIFDHDKACHRDCTEADVDDKHLVLDSLSNFEGDYCNLVLGSERYGGAAPRGHSTPDASIAFVRRRVQDRLGVRNVAARTGRRLPFRWLQRSADERRLEVLAHMVLHGAQETVDLLETGNTSFVWCNPISPLQYHPDETRAIMGVARRQTRGRFIMISPEVMMGATGPVTLPGTLVQHNAEVLGGTVLAQLASPGTPVIYGCVSAVMDLRTAEISQGHLETAMLNVAAVQMANRYGMPSRIAPGNTSARQPGPRAAAEALLGLYLGLTSGANLITTGLLDSTLMISYEHLVLMDEMIEQIRSVVSGIGTDGLDPEVAEIVAHGHPSPGFLASDHTLKNMKRDIYYSDYCGRTESSFQDWYEKAHQRVKEILVARTEPPELDATTQDRLNALVELLTDDQAWRADTDAWWESYAGHLA